MKFVVLFSWLFYVGFSLHHRAPVLDLQQSSGDVYHGTALETDTVVKISPEIRILDGTGPVCSYVVEPVTGPNGSEKIDENGSVPFVVDVEDEKTGRAVVRLKSDAVLDCSDPMYRFKISAKRCDDGSLSDGAIVEIWISDVNNHDPVFVQPNYRVEVDEGRIYDRILQLQATDDDCGHYAEICRYEITNNAKMFDITPSGILKNTQPLNWSLSHTHLISVVAHDCGMRHSLKPALITVKVNEVCVTGLTGHYEKLDYQPASGALPLMADVDLRFCQPNDCAPTFLEAKIRLDAQISNGKPCDRETLSVDRQKKICAADSASVELLPNSRNVKLENAAAATSTSSSSEEEDENEVTPVSDEVYVFDGQNNAVIVPPNVLKPVVPEIFTLSFWMKHEKPAKSDDHHNSKENIFCSSDDHRMNRHHFAIYVRNCKMEVLFRHEATKDEAENNFTPAEWRWRLPEVCDGRWHHYSFNVKFPQIDLFVDGRAEANKIDSPEILDDWPMHNVKDIKTRTVVGACWHGGANKMAQHFRGYLSGMTMLPGKIERPTVLQCLMQCKEQLEFFGLDKLRPGEEAIFNNDMSELTLKATKSEDFVELLRKVSYLNSRTTPTMGERNVVVETTVMCKGQSSPLILPALEKEISVTKPAPVKISLTGSILLRRKESEVEQGVNIFPDLKIVAERKDSFGSKNVDQKLDYCKIKTKPALDKQREFFSSPASLFGNLAMEFEHAADGLILKGSETAKNYEKILEQIHYFNSWPNSFAKRIFYVECAAGRSKSDEFIVSLSIDPATPKIALTTSAPANQSDLAEITLNTDVGPSAPAEHEEIAPPENHLAVNKLDNFVPQPKIGSGALPLVHQNGYENFGTSSQTGPGGAIAIVVVVCVGFLLLLIVVGILKVRSTHRRLLKSRRPTEDGDLAWDDSGMNITVNPIEVEVVPEPTPPHEDDDSDGSSDDDSYRDEDGCSDEDEEEVLPHVETTNGSTGLEWDDSTLHHPAVHNPRTHTYRV